MVPCSFHIAVGLLAVGLPSDRSMATVKIVTLYVTEHTRRRQLNLTELVQKYTHFPL